MSLCVFTWKLGVLLRLAGCYYQAPEFFFRLSSSFPTSFSSGVCWFVFCFFGGFLFFYFFIFLNTFSKSQPDLLAILLPVFQVLG